jgi:photosystem II stability/assembly factor-like uncharacterized protein
MRQVPFPLAVVLVAALGAPAPAQPPIAFADAGLHAVQFVDASEGWACGDDGTVWHSIDGGKKWERQLTETRASLRGLHFVTEYTGWAVGRLEAPNGTSVGVMLKTTDGGLKWEQVGLNVMPGLNAVRFYDEKNGFVCGDSSDAFPTGVFTTTDGGLKWEPVKGPRLPSCRSADVVLATKGALIGGAWGKLGTLVAPALAVKAERGTPAEYREAELDPLGGRGVHGVACSTSVSDTGRPWCFAACDGGAVLTSSDGGKTWGYVNLGLPAPVLACCDFRCVAAFANHVWVAGRPGGVVLHSADLGKTWEVQKTDVAVPVNGIHFLDDKTGWLVCDLGCIYGTTDGGKTWLAQRTGGQRAAALFLHAGGKNTPLDVVAALGAADGYLCAATGLTSADPATVDPKRAGDDLRLRDTMRLAGGASAECGWSFPVAAHAAGLPPRELLATWDRAHGATAGEQLLRQAVLAIRIWQPEVVICDTIAPETGSAEALALNATKEAFKRAADPNCFPEQITTLGLKPWGPKKLYALWTEPKTAAVKFDSSAFNKALNDSPKDYTETATRLLAGDAAIADRRCFVLVAHRLAGADGHANLMDGITGLAPGGTARRAAVPIVIDSQATLEAKAEAQAEKQRAVRARRAVEAVAGMSDTEFGGIDKLMAALHTEMKKMPDDVAARTAFAVGSRLVREGKWADAREVYGLIALNYPAHPLAVEAFRWLARYHASTEVRRRFEIQQKLSLGGITFEANRTNRLAPASGTVATIGTATVAEDQYRFHSPDMIFKWHAAALELEPKLAGFGPVYTRDPASWLCFNAARRQIGKFVEAEAFIAEYFKLTPGAVTMAPGVDPWRDCLAAELWLSNKAALPVPPKPVGVCRRTESRPFLDGKLDDECWAKAKPMELKVTAAAGDRPDDARAFGTQYRTESRFAYDERYLYVAVRCEHPAGKKVEPVEKRTRDADLAGHDRVDILIDVDRDYQTYYRFQIDHRGALAEDCWGDKTWNPKYHVAFHATDTGWTAELAIPIVELTGDAPAHGKTWAVNVSRVVPGMGLQAWSGPADNDPRPEGMGLLQFRADR